jgi:hypothetical protein
MMRQIIKRILTWLMGMIRQNARHTFWKRGITEKQAIARGVRRFFQQNYELRYNVMKQTEEFRPKNVTAARENFTALEKNFTASRENVTAVKFGFRFPPSCLRFRLYEKCAVKPTKKLGK